MFVYGVNSNPGDGRRERYAVGRLKILIVEALCLSAAAFGAADDLGYSPDGGLVSFGEFDYVYDSASRLTEAVLWVRTTRRQTSRITEAVTRRAATTLSGSCLPLSAA